jgi:hypothetical protein
MPSGDIDLHANFSAGHLTYIEVKFLETFPDKFFVNRRGNIRELNKNDKPFPFFANISVLFLGLHNHRGIHQPD